MFEASKFLLLLKVKMSETLRKVVVTDEESTETVEKTSTEETEDNLNPF